MVSALAVARLLSQWRSAISDCQSTPSRRKPVSRLRCSTVRLRATDPSPSAMRCAVCGMPSSHSTMLVRPDSPLVYLASKPRVASRIGTPRGTGKKNSWCASLLVRTTGSVMPRSCSVMLRVTQSSFCKRRSASPAGLASVAKGSSSPAAISARRRVRATGKFGAGWCMRTPGQECVAGGCIRRMG
ncbi:hypothetical protein D3C71_1395460 [compost metagenome]